MISRRNFIQKSAMAAAAMVWAPAAWARQAEAMPAFDFHTHPGLFPVRGVPGYGGDNGVARTVADMNSNGLTGAFFSLVADLPNIKAGPTGIQLTGSYQAGDGWKEYQRQLKNYREVLSTLPVVVAHSAKDFERAWQSKKVAAYLASEGGDFLEGSAERVTEMYADGVRSIQLVHYHPNELGDLQTESAQHNGLSKAGKAVVQKMNQLGMLIDVAHASYETTKAVCEASTAPVILSHSILKREDSRPLSRRAISEDHARIVAGTGGVIGAWPSGFHTNFDEFVEGTLRLIDVVDVDHVGLGTDMDGNFKPVFSNYNQLNTWREALQAKGLNQQEVSKVLGGNAQQVLQKVFR